MKKILTFTIIILTTLFSNIVFAGEIVPFNYNVMPDVQNGYVIDSNHTNQIGFSLFENENAIYLNGNLIEVEDDRFSISIDGLTGKQSFILSNGSGEEFTYTCYISDKKGYLEGYNLDELKKSYKTYVKTIKDITVIYTSKDSKTINKVEKIINELPDDLLVNVKEMKFIPAKHPSKAAGITKYNKISFYNLSSYSNNTLKNVIIHEISHTWAHELMKEKEIDYSYTDYKVAVKSDKKFPSKYAKTNVAVGNYSEDFAESVSFYLINVKSFTKKYPARAIYIETLLNRTKEIDVNYADKKDI
ncbi:MAG: hypothetical protein IJX99_09440 [Clostridia bacterium]|nr:hypothetical protein [Clostridia bacterium]